MSIMLRTTRIALCFSATALAGCAKNENAAGDSTTIASSTASSTVAAPAPAPAPVNLADVAGKWNMRAVPTSGDTSATSYVMTATNSTSGWTLTFPGRPPMPVKVSVDADSIMISAAPYASVRRKGVRVSTNGALRLQNGDLAGITTAHYQVKTADSVMTLTTTGTRTR
jgi:hypothetical protein